QGLLFRRRVRRRGGRPAARHLRVERLAQWLDLVDPERLRPRRPPPPRRLPRPVPARPPAGTGRPRRRRPAAGRRTRQRPGAADLPEPGHAADGLSGPGEVSLVTTWWHAARVPAHTRAA